MSATDPLVLEYERLGNRDSYVLQVCGEYSPRQPMTIRIQWDHGQPIEAFLGDLKVGLAYLAEEFVIEAPLQKLLAERQGGKP